MLFQNRPLFYRLAFLCTLVATTFAARCAQAVTLSFTSLVDTSSSVPGQTGLTFGGFGNNAISGNNVAFSGIYGSNTGMYVADLNTLAVSVVADNSVTPAGQPNPLTGAANPSISGSNVVFIGTVSGTSGVYSSSVGSVGATLVVQRGDALPASLASGTFSNPASPSVSGSTVAFFSTFNNGTNTSGIFTATVGVRGGTTDVVDRNTIAPGTGTPGTKFSTFDNIVSVSGSSVVFRGGYSGGSGVYSVNTDGTMMSIIADTNTQVPGQTIGTKFSSLASASPKVSDGTVSFIGLYSGGSGIYLGAPGVNGATLVADTNTLAVGTAKFTDFNGFTANGEGNVAFIAAYTGGNGLFAEYQGQVVDVINFGDALFGSTLQFINPGNAFIDGNNISFNYLLNNGTSGVAVATIVPEPGTWALVIAGGCLLTIARRRRV